MAYYWTCPECGSNLDPGERCDCREIRKKKEAVPAAQTGRPQVSTTPRIVYHARRTASSPRMEAMRK